MIQRSDGRKYKQGENPRDFMVFWPGKMWIWPGGLMAGFYYLVPGGLKNVLENLFLRYLGFVIIDYPE